MDNVQELLNQAYRSKYYYEYVKNQYENEVTQNSRKIERLKTALETVKTCKSQAAKARNGLNNYMYNDSNFTDWKGEKKDEAYEGLSSEVIPTSKTYVDRIDDVLDMIGDEITRLQNRNMTLQGDIFHIGGLINYFRNEIWKLLN